MDSGQLAHNIEQVIFTIAKLLLYPVLIAAILCLIWVLIELGYFLYEAYLRVRYRDLDALEIRTLRASRVTIRAVQGSLPAQSDGEILCVDGTRLDIQLLPRQIEVVCPKAGAG